MDMTKDGSGNAVSDDADHSARLQGVNYRQFLGTLHHRLKPRTYLEVGTFDGYTLRMASCASIAVDPKFQIAVDIVGGKPSCWLFQETSDDFFKNRSPRELFGAPIAMAFLDGMHQFDFLLRDFINTEKHCDPRSIVVLHDCLPPGFYMTVRDQSDSLIKKSRFGRFWTGDVWRIVPVLQRYRPDLSITLLDCQPTGLVVISRLAPGSTTLQDNYEAIIEEYASDEIDRKEYDAYWRDLVMTDSSTLRRYSELTGQFWRQV